MNSTLRLFATLSLVAMAACSISPKGKTEAEKIAYLDKMERESLQRLFEERPRTKELVEGAAGYVVLREGVTKVPLIGWGSGYGVAVNNRTGRRTYLRNSRYEIGWGYGVRKYRVIFVFQDRNLFREMEKGKYKFEVGAEATARVEKKAEPKRESEEVAGESEEVDEPGAAELTEEMGESEGTEEADGIEKNDEKKRESKKPKAVSTFVLTDTGISATLTFRLLSYGRDRELNDFWMKTHASRVHDDGVDPGAAGESLPGGDGAR